MIKDDYSIPFLSDEKMKEKLCMIVNMHDPNSKKGYARPNISKLQTKPYTLSSSPYRESTNRLKGINDQSSLHLNEHSYNTSRLEENEENDYTSSKYAFTNDEKSPRKNISSIMNSNKNSKNRDELCKSLIQEPKLEDVLMPPVSLMDRNFNNTKIVYK